MNKTSIIMCAYDTNDLQRNITSSAIGNIQKYTDTEEYELIVVDNHKKDTNWLEIPKKYNCIKIDNLIDIEDIGYSASMNLGASKADPATKYFCFIHNDVLVWEGWLNKLREYLDSGEWDAVFPSQGYFSRQDILDAYSGKRVTLDNDAGLTLITKEAFSTVKGFDERMKSVYQEMAFRKRMIHYQIRSTPTAKTIITHIGWATLGADDDAFERNRIEEGQFIDNYVIQ